MEKSLYFLIVCMFLSANASAEYIIKIPLEKQNGGALPDNSIKFVSELSPQLPEPTPDPEIPVEEQPEEPLAEGLEDYQNITGTMMYAGNDSYVANTWISPINSVNGDVIYISLAAIQSNQFGLMVVISREVSSLIDSATYISYVDNESISINCPIINKGISNGETTVMCQLESFANTGNEKQFNISIK